MFMSMLSDPQTGEVKYTQIWSKAAKGFRLRKQYADKTYVFRGKLMGDILEHAEKNIIDRTSERVR